MAVKIACNVEEYVGGAASTSMSPLEGERHNSI